MRKRIYHSLTAAFSALFVFLGYWEFKISYLRFWEALLDLGRSVRYYFCWLFNLEDMGTPTVTDYSKVLFFETNLPEEWSAFREWMQEYISLLCDPDNFYLWIYHLCLGMEKFAKVLVAALPFVVLLVILIHFVYGTGNTNHNEDTVPLQVFKRAAAILYQPVKNFVVGYYRYLQEYSAVVKLWIAAWLFHLNLASIIVAFVAWYFYFSAAFAFDTLYIQFVKLVIDLQPVFSYVPWWVWLMAAYPLFHYWRKSIGKSFLQHYEARNCGFIKELPIVSMSCGSMGKKKTTLITDMALSQEVMFRQKALEIIQGCDMKFPYFPWICFELELKKCMEYGTVYNLATTKNWIQKKQQRFSKHYNAAWQLYGYDCKKHSMTYMDGLQEYDLFGVLETYALAYFVYIVESSLIVSNYAIRMDHTKVDEGNFPMWYADFFPEVLTEGRFSKILDFDALRLGKHLVEDNPNIGSFEFGVVAISEIGKERGNNLELKEVKKGTAEANQKNDLFNAWLKMCRHSATIDHYPFIKVFTDEQRPESWGADARDLCDILHIVSSGEQRLALPFYTIEEMVSEWAFEKFISLYYKFRYLRGDNTLLIYLLKTVTAFLWRRNLRLNNQFGYCVLHIEKARGTMDGKAEKKKYFLMNRKIYARRFSTDCFSDYFSDLAQKSTVGLQDYIAYANEKATVEELKLQNSYFINSLYH